MNEILVIVAIAVVIAIFLVIREFWTWYWKINEILRVLRGIRQDIAVTNQHLAELQAVNTEMRSALQNPDWPPRSPPV